MEKSENFTQHSKQIRTPLSWNKNELHSLKIIVKIKFSQFYSDMLILMAICLKENFGHLKTTGTGNVW